MKVNGDCYRKIFGQQGHKFQSLHHTQLQMTCKIVEELFMMLLWSLFVVFYLPAFCQVKSSAFHNAYCFKADLSKNQDVNVYDISSHNQDLL